MLSSRPTLRFRLLCKEQGHILMSLGDFFTQEIAVDVLTWVPRWKQHPRGSGPGFNFCRRVLRVVMCACIATPRLCASPTPHYYPPAGITELGHQRFDSPQELFPFDARGCAFYQRWGRGCASQLPRAPVRESWITYACLFIAHTLHNSRRQRIVPMPFAHNPPSPSVPRL